VKAMPTKSKDSNPDGLSKAALDLQGMQHEFQEMQHEVNNLLNALSSSKDLATELDRAVMNNSKQEILQSIRKGGLLPDKKKTLEIERTDPDRALVLRYCICCKADDCLCLRISLCW
jgi:type VI protein secretion system component VasF